MAYQPCRCSVTLLCPVCISVFCTPLALSVLLPFMLYAPYPFNAPFLDCAFLLLRSASLHTPEFSCTVTTPISSLFHILIVSVLFVHAIFAMPLHAHSTPNSSTSRVLCLIIIVTLQLLRQFFPRVQHHWVFCLDFSASLAVEALRLLCLRRAYPFYFQLQTSMLIHLSIPLRVVFLHWTKLGDSSSPLAITQSLFESSGRNHQWFLAVTL
jgi:hypothetical protein